MAYFGTWGFLFQVPNFSAKYSSIFWIFDVKDNSILQVSFKIIQVLSQSNYILSLSKSKSCPISIKIFSWLETFFALIKTCSKPFFNWAKIVYLHIYVRIHKKNKYSVFSSYNSDPYTNLREPILIDPLWVTHLEPLQLGRPLLECLPLNDLIGVANFRYVFKEIIFLILHCLLP